MHTTAISTFVTLLLFLVHSYLVPYLTLVDVVPDILLIWIVYLAIRRGQLVSTGAGFVIGLVLDLSSGESGMLGLAALTKSVGGFMAGYFFNENRMLQVLSGYQFIVAVFVTSLLHNVLYFLIFLQGSGMGWWDTFLRYAVPTSLYTALLALLPMFIFSRKYVS